MVHADKPLKNTMRFARWILKATDTHSEFVVLIAFPQKWLRERSSMLCYSTLLFLL